MFLFCLGCIAAHSQEYTVTSEGVDNTGNYSVRIVVSTKKASKSAEDLVRLYAIHGVMFRGIAAAKGYSAQPPLINDPNIEQTKKASEQAIFIAIAPDDTSKLFHPNNFQTKHTVIGRDSYFLTDESVDAMLNGI